MFTITFTCTRPDVSAPFYHDSPSSIAAISALSTIRSAAQPGSLTYSNTMSLDELTYVGVYEFIDLAAEEQFTVDLLNSYPAFYEERDVYYTAHGHTMDIVFS